MRLTLLRLLLLLCSGFMATTAMAADPVEGKEYQLVKPPQPTDGGKKIVVTEFFSYACSHCNEFQSHLEAWITKRKPKDVEMRFVPMVFRDSWKPVAKLYYSLEALGLVEALHGRVYSSIYRDGAQLVSDDAVLKWAKGLTGLDPKVAAKIGQLPAAYASFGIDAKLQRSMDMGRQYGVTGTPSVAVDGRYITAPSMTHGEQQGPVDYPQFFTVLDRLIEMARKAGHTK